MVVLFKGRNNLKNDVVLFLVTM